MARFESISTFRFRYSTVLPPWASALDCSVRVMARRFCSRRRAVRYSLLAAWTARPAPSVVAAARLRRESSIWTLSCCMAGHSGL